MVGVVVERHAHTGGILRPRRSRSTKASQCASVSSRREMARSSWRAWATHAKASCLRGDRRREGQRGGGGGRRREASEPSQSKRCAPVDGEVDRRTRERSLVEKRPDRGARSGGGAGRFAGNARRRVVLARRERGYSTPRSRERDSRSVGDSWGVSVRGRAWGLGFGGIRERHGGLSVRKCRRAA